MASTVAQDRDNPAELERRSNKERSSNVVIPSLMDRAGAGTTPIMERFDHRAKDYSKGVQEYNKIAGFNDWPIQALNPTLQATNPIVFLDIGLTTNGLGKLIIELFAHSVPKTARNFRELCCGDSMKGELTYKDCRFHSIVAGVMICAGDITNGDGTGGMSIYGPAFPDESLELRHVGPGIVTMLNTGRDSNNSQFAITLAKTDWLDGTCVVVGKVLEGLQCLHTVAEKYGSTSGLPKQEVYVTDCGELANYVIE